MARAIIGSRGPSRALLDDDCGARKSCGAPKPADAAPGAPGGDLGILPVLRVIYRHRTGYDPDEGTPVFGWKTVIEGRAFVFEERKEWDAAAGVTMVKARMTIGNTEHVEVPETAVVKEPATGLIWDIEQTTAFPDRLEILASRVWREAVSAADVEPPLIEDDSPIIIDGGDASTEDYDEDLDGGGA